MKTSIRGEKSFRDCLAGLGLYRLIGNERCLSAGDSTVNPGSSEDQEIRFLPPNTQEEL